ncbi:lonrf2 [Pungitius sinensis]
METEVRSHRGELLAHQPPGPAGVCSEMLEVAEEANRAGDFNLAVEIYGSMLSDLQQPDRGLCLRKADSLTRAGRISEALDSFCTAASLGKLRPEELPVLVETIARTLREKELGLSNAHGTCSSSSSSSSSGGADGVDSDGECADDEALDLFSCRLCRRLLHEPTTVECGHTFCKSCVEDASVEECAHCEQRLGGKDAVPNGHRVDVVLSGLLAKLFSAESQARKFWVEGELLWKNQNLSQALEKYNAAVDLVPSSGRLLCQRASLHLEMRSFSQAVQDGSSLCRMKPLWSKDSEVSETQDESLYRLPSPSPCRSELGAGESSTKSLASVLAALPAPPGGLKRKHSGDGPAVAFNPPSKLLRPDEESGVEAASPFGGRSFPAGLLDSGDMECSLCMRLFYEPVATPCGHTFCLKCLERCLDHNSNCPLCKENLSEYLATRGYSKTLLMEEVLQRYLGDELAERKKIHEEEMKELSNLNQEVPIFICTMAFPTITCPLHVFEPRYRLMIRRSMETGTKQFGMCIADELKGFADYGCMLEVRDVKFFPDGRSVVDTIGVSRFKVLGHGQRDGYNTAKIEYLEDKKAEGEELAELLKLHNAVYEQANNWFTSLKDNMKSQILSHFGQLPSKDSDPQASPSGPAWCWWLLAVLPLENRAQLTILAMTSLKDRLLAIRRVLIFVTRRRPR